MSVFETVAKVNVSEEEMIVNMIETLKDLDSCKGKLEARLVNAEWYHLRNSLKEGGSTMIHDEVADDLMVVYSYRLDEAKTVYINKRFLEKAGVSECDVKKTAMENSLEGKQTKVASMGEILGLPDEMIGEQRLIVVTNGDNLYGAIKILKKEVQDELAAKLGEGYMLIPSSIHEWIATTKLDVDATKEMIGEVNKNEVDYNEQLSDHPYTIKNGRLVTMA